MKQYLCLLLLLMSASVYAQPDESLFCSFEAPYNKRVNQFIIDTVTYPNNIWQIGKPSKPVFDSALSYPNAIVTDTLLSYPVNDTSVFLIKHTKLKENDLHFALHFRYRLDIDSGEIAKIEVSGNSGKHWINVMTQDSIYKFGWSPQKPNFDSSTSGWREFHMYMAKWAGADSTLN